MNNLVARAAIALTIALASNAGQAQDAKSPSQVPATATKAVPGYLIANFTIIDQAMFQKYRDAVGPIRLRYGGKPVVLTANAQKVEGRPQTVMAVMEFASLADVERFYFSPEYSEVKQLRLAATEGWLLLTEGFVPPRQ